MTLPRTVSDVISRHVTLEVECIDRMYLNVYQPRIQSPAQVAAFFRYHRRDLFASSAVMSPISKAFLDAVGKFVHERKGFHLSLSPKASVKMMSLERI
jgi:hypothetical protein